MGFQAKVTAGIAGHLSGAPDVGAVKYSFDETVELVLSLGTGAKQATNVFTDTRTLAASATETLDMSGVLSNALGAVLAFTAIKAILITADPGNSNNVVIGGGSNPLVGFFADVTDKFVIPPGGVFLAANPSASGWPVTAATGDLLLVANSGAGSAVSYTITVVGEA